MKITFGMIIFNGEHFLKQCLESVYPFAHQILIAEGPVSYWQEQGYLTSFDKTNEILNSFPDPQNKIKIVHGQYTEKDAQCKAYMQFLDTSTDYIWSLDCDEVFKPEDIETLMDLLEKEKYTSVGIQSCSFYGGFERHIGGFEEERDQFLRIFKVYPGSTWLTHRPPTIVTPPGITTLPRNHLSSDVLWEQHGIRMYHYSYVMPHQVKQKVSYYKAAVSKQKCIDNYYESVYLPWVKGSPEQRLEIEKQFNGVHEWKPEHRTHTFTKPFLEEHPESIQSSIEQLKMDFNNQLIGS